MILHQWHDIPADRTMFQIEVSGHDLRDAYDAMDKTDRAVFNCLAKEKSIVEKLMALQLIAQALEKENG